MISLVIAVLIHCAAGAVFCGRFSGARACVSAEFSGATLCVEGSSSFSATASSLDRAIVDDFAHIASIQTERCVHDWLRARCAAVFFIPGGNSSMPICASTCAALSSCQGATVSQCANPNNAPSCTDLATISRNCVLPPDAPAAGGSAPRPAPRPPFGGGGVNFGGSSSIGVAKFVLVSCLVLYATN